MFGATYNGDRRTVRAALDANAHEDELDQSHADRQDWQFQANANLREQGRILDRCEALAKSAEKELADAKAEVTLRLRASQHALSVVEQQARDLRRKGEHERKYRLRIEEEIRACRLENEAEDGRTDDVRRRLGVAKARLAGLHAMATRMFDLVETLSPTHALLKPTGRTYVDGRVQVGLDVIDDQAHDDHARALARNVPTRDSQLVGDQPA